MKTELRKISFETEEMDTIGNANPGCAWIDYDDCRGCAGTCGPVVIVDTDDNVDNDDVPPWVTDSDK